MDVLKFRADVYALATRACAKDDLTIRSEVFRIADILVGMYEKNLVKINHSALELVCAHSLIKEGYSVKVEHRLDKSLVCDVLGEKGDGQLVVEIETGFIPPEAALQPSTYARARIASKIARYSKFAGQFALGTTPTYVLDVPEFFVKPPRSRTEREAAEMKVLTDTTYSSPPISMDELIEARLHTVFLVDVDTATTQRLDPETYARTAGVMLDWHRAAQGLNA